MEPASDPFLARLYLYLTKYLNTRYPHGFRNPAKVLLRANGSNIYPQLTVHKGFACYRYRTVNYHELTKHISQQHLGGRQATSSRISDLYDDVYLQTWTHSASRRYWIVKKDGSTIRPVASRGVSEYRYTSESVQGLKNRSALTA